MFLNQARGRDDKVKKFKNRAEYFQTYNQQRKEYLKECGKVRRLVAKYNPEYQDQRKGDRHKFNPKTRYRLKKITDWLTQNGFELKPFSSFQKNSCNGGWKNPYIHISVLKNTFLFVKKGFQPLDFIFVNLFNQQKKELAKLKPHWFLKRLEKLKKQAQLINSIPQNCLVEPDSKISLKKPLPLNYNSDSYCEKRHAYYFLLKYNGYLWKTGMKWGDGFYRSALDKDCVCQRTDIDDWVKKRNEKNWKYLFNYLKTNYEVEYMVQTARCQCSKHLIFKHHEPIPSFQTYFSYYDYRQQRLRKIITGSCQSKGKLLSGVGSEGKSLEWWVEKKEPRSVITNQANLLSIFHKFYLCREPQLNKIKKKKFLNANQLIKSPSIKQIPAEKLKAGTRKAVRVKYIETIQDFICTKENDSLDKIRLEVAGKIGDYFFNSHHRRKYSERLNRLEKGEELNLVLWGGNTLTFVDRVYC